MKMNEVYPQEKCWFQIFMRINCLKNRLDLMAGIRTLVGSAGKIRYDLSCDMIFGSRNRNVCGGREPGEKFNRLNNCTPGNMVISSLVSFFFIKL